MYLLLSVGRYLISWCLLLLSHGVVQAQYGTTQGLVLFSGEVVDEEGNGLADVHVQNMSSKHVTVTDRSGFFSIYLHRTHRLRFSAVGYRPFYFSLNEHNPASSQYELITLKSATIALSEVTVHSEKEERATEMMLPPPGKPLFSFGYQGEQTKIKPNVGNPVSLLYYWLSKEGKQQRKLEALLKQEKIKKLVDKRFDSDEFWQITALTGQELEEFKNFCGMSDLFILSASDYEFLLRIKDCYNKFKK
jgi:hypothetical protein